MWEPSPRQKKFLRWAGFPVFYLLCLILFAYLTFPFDRLKERVISEFDAAQAAGSGMRLEIDDVSWYWVTGVEAQGVRLISPVAPDADGQPQQPQVFEIEDVHVRYSLWAHLLGDLHVSFGMVAGGGEMEGEVSDDEGVRRVSLTFQNLGISGLPFIASAVGLPMTGALTGTVQLDLPEQKLSKGSGAIQLTVSQLSLGDGKAKIRNTIALPRLDAGTLELVATVKDGHVNVEKLSANGPDLELHSEGRLRLRDPFGTSRAELDLAFRFTDRYKTKNDITKGLFGEPGSTTPGVFDLDAKNKQAKREDGFYAWRVAGPFKKLELQPAREPRSSRTSARRPGSRNQPRRRSSRARKKVSGKAAKP